MFGPGGSQECDSSSMSNMKDACQCSLPIKPSKNVGLAAAIYFLGMELDSYEGIIMSPMDKLCNLKAQLRIWQTRRACKTWIIVTLRPF